MKRLLTRGGEDDDDDEKQQNNNNGPKEAKLDDIICNYSGVEAICVSGPNTPNHVMKAYRELYSPEEEKTTTTKNNKTTAMVPRKRN